MIQALVMKRLSKYNKPVKTKHLAERLNLDRTEITKTLNQLSTQNKITYVQSKKGSEEKFVGWISVDKLQQKPIFLGIKNLGVNHG